MISTRSRLAAVLAGAIALTLAIGAPAEARRGGSFGSRGARTYSAPAPTYSSPGYVGPVQRSMTAPPAGYAPGYAPSYQPPRPSYGGYGPGYGARPGWRPGFGGGLLAGLATGGLIGALMGHGFGGGWGAGWGAGGMGMGVFATLLQLALLALVIWFAVRLFRRRDAVPQPAGFGAAYDAGPGFDPAPPGPYQGPWGAAAGSGEAPPAQEIPVVPADPPNSIEPVNVRPDVPTVSPFWNPLIV